MASYRNKASESDKRRFNPIAQAVLGIESAGGHWESVGPPAFNGDRAYGASQVMGRDVPIWTKRWYGRALTPSEYLKNKDAQIAVTNGEFDRLAKVAQTRFGATPGTEKYVRLVAAGWFGGDGGMRHYDSPTYGDGYTSMRKYTTRVWSDYQKLGVTTSTTPTTEPVTDKPDVSKLKTTLARESLPDAVDDKVYTESEIKGRESEFDPAGARIEVRTIKKDVKRKIRERVPGKPRTVVDWTPSILALPGDQYTKQREIYDAEIVNDNPPRDWVRLAPGQSVIGKLPPSTADRVRDTEATGRGGLYKTKDGAIVLYRKGGAFYKADLPAQLDKVRADNPSAIVTVDNNGSIIATEKDGTIKRYSASTGVIPIAIPSPKQVPGPDEFVEREVTRKEKVDVPFETRYYMRKRGKGTPTTTPIEPKDGKEYYFPKDKGHTWNVNT